MTKHLKSGRSIHGVLLLEKPEGVTSNDALQSVKKLYDANKAGHTGSLDPLASGMLPICFGEATKFSQFLLEADKHYLVTATLGIKTSTGDREGEVVMSRDTSAVTQEKLQAILTDFLGTIEQIPSMFSAIKHKGQPLYKLARKGIEVDRPKREVNIYEISLLDFNPQTFSLSIKCSKGTYVRTLVEDIGEALGCGAHVATLHRLSVGHFSSEHMHTLLHLEHLKKSADLSTMDSYILPIDSAISTWPELSLSEAAIYYLKRGQAVIPPTGPSSGWVRLTRKNGGFLGVGEILATGWLAPRRLLEITD